LHNHDKVPKIYFIKPIKPIICITFKVYVPGNNILQNSPNAVTFTTGRLSLIITAVDGIASEYSLSINPLTPKKIKL
jgi:hypothetical protein